MNDILDKFDIAGSSAEALKQMRDNFESRWNFLNNIRTVFSIIRYYPGGLRLYLE